MTDGYQFSARALRTRLLDFLDCVVDTFVDVMFCPIVRKLSQLSSIFKRGKTGMFDQ
jgi:hypothetical protein